MQDVTLPELNVEPQKLSGNINDNYSQEVRKIITNYQTRKEIKK